MLRVSWIIALALMGGGVVRAEEWKSPDGKIAVTVPNPKRFEQVPPEPGALVTWQAKDGSFGLFVGEMAIPPGVRLQQGPLEIGVSADLHQDMKNAKIASSTTAQRNGFEYFTITAQGENELGVTVYFTQIITGFGGKVYKSFAAGYGLDPRNDPDVMAFLNSFRPLVPAPPLMPEPAVSAPQPMNDADRAQKLGEGIGRLLFFLILVGGLIYGARKSSGKKKRKKAEDEYGDF